MRSYLRLRELPVVLPTGTPRGPQARRASKVMGVYAVLPKGEVSPADVQRAIEHALLPVP